MSGGRWDYAGSCIEQGLLDVANDPEAKRRWPAICEAMGALARLLYRIERDMDWDLSSDCYIEDDRLFEAEVADALRAIAAEMGVAL